MGQGRPCRGRKWLGRSGGPARSQEAEHRAEQDHHHGERAEAQQIPDEAGLGRVPRRRGVRRLGGRRLGGRLPGWRPDAHVRAGRIRRQDEHPTRPKFQRIGQPTTVGLRPVPVQRIDFPVPVAVAEDPHRDAVQVFALAVHRGLDNVIPGRRGGIRRL
jgi:hypothetical protein